MGKAIDCTGMKFNKLTCIERVRDKEKKETYYICKCDCGNKIKIRSDSVKSGHTKSCGKCSLTTYDLTNDYGIGYSQKGDVFYFDKEDYDAIKNHTWSKNSNGYIRTTINDKQIYLHRLLLSPDSFDSIDHINRKKNDNRKSNLRLVTNSQNGMNKGLNTANTSGATGVYFDKVRKKWVAQLTKDYKTISLGRFKNKQDAINKRIQKEIELFGEYSPYIESNYETNH